MSPRWAQWHEVWVELDSEGMRRQPRVDQEWDNSSQKAQRGLETLAEGKITEEILIVISGQFGTEIQVDCKVIQIKNLKRIIV